MDVILLCPSGLATGGTEGIHNLACHLNKVGAEAKILYVGKGDNPQPKEYKKYGVEYITEFPVGFKGTVVFPEVWGNQVLDPKCGDCKVAINWQGVDVYDWHVPEKDRGMYLRRGDVIHIANSDYAVNHLTKLGLKPVKIADCLNDEFYDVLSEDTMRRDAVCYNPIEAKMTSFQREVMARCTNELGIKFKMVEGLDRQGVINLFKHSKLYIDFGVFSGRERLPREAVMCGCCIITSTKGTAGYFNDNSILDKYKIDDVTQAMQMIKYVLKNFKQCKPEFDLYRDKLKREKEHYIEDVRALYEIFNNHSGT